MCKDNSKYKESWSKMKTFQFKKIDAFATQLSAGNPAGYIWLDSKESITNDEMQKIARELKGFVNEVGYAYKEDSGAYRLKYYSTEREVEFCGHATIAMMYDIIKQTKDLQTVTEVRIITNRGELSVENRIANEDAVFIMAPIPTFTPCTIPREEIIKTLKIKDEDINDSYKIGIVNGGLETLIVPIKSLECILNITPQLEACKQFCLKNNIDIIEVFCDEVSNQTSNFRTRVFAPTFGYLEDPATGSGNSAFGYYLLENNLWDSDTLVIEQNSYRDNYNKVKLKKKQDETQRTRVQFGGGAVTRIEGNYILY